MKRNKIITVFLILLLLVSNMAGIFAETYDFKVNITREFSRENVTIDYVNEVNNEVVITYTIKPDDIEVNQFPVSTPPKEVVLVIDNSGSMKWDLDGNFPSNLQSRMEIIKEAANNFVDSLAEFGNIKLSVVIYSSRADVYNSNSPLLDLSNSGNVSSIKGYIDLMYVDNNNKSNTGDAIRRGHYTLENGNDSAEKYLVLLSDGDPTTYSYRGEGNNRSFFKEDGDDFKIASSDGTALDYAKIMAGKLDADTQNFFISIGNNGANKLKEVSDEIASYYKNALTVDEIKDFYNDISKKISAVLKIKNVVLKDEIPQGLEIVGYPVGMTVNGQSISMPVGDISFALNSDKTKYVAEPVVVEISVRRNMPGTFNFASNTNSGFSYTDLDGEMTHKSFSVGSIVYKSESVKDLIITSIESGLSDFKYGSSKNIETIYSSSSFPTGVKVYNPVLVIELNVLSEVTNLGLEYSYSTLDIILNNELVAGTVTRDGKDSIKLYVSDINFGNSDNTFPDNTTVKLSNRFSVSFESDQNGQLKPEVLAVIRGITGFEDAEAWDIEYIIEEVLSSKYLSKDTILKMETYVLYDETNKTSVLPNVRDKKISIKSEYIMLSNSLEIPKEY